MTPDTRERRPRPLQTAVSDTNHRQGTAPMTAVDSTAQGGQVIAFPRYGEPSTFGLSAAELAAEVRRCRRAGWFRWELRSRFAGVSA